MKGKLPPAYSRDISCPYAYKQLTSTMVGAVIPAGLTDNVPFTIPKGQGDVKQVAIWISEVDPANLALQSVTMQGDGTDIIQNASLLRFSSIYDQQNQRINTIIPEAAEFTARVINGGAAALSIFFEFYFVPAIEFQMDWHTQVSHMAQNYGAALNAMNQ